MKIKNIKINSFGNLNDKEIELSDNINIIYGKNEAGKSTLLKFITNSFYGTSKNKKGREFSDYDRYKPWGRDDFSGKIKYELDNGEEYEVYREFGKKNPKIFNGNLEDVSKNYSIDKNLGNQFFYEQTKVDEETFLSTIASMQQEVKLEKNSQNVLIQKMANIAGTGEDNVSYKKAIDKLYKKQLDEVGTYRSQGKPINIAQNKLNELKNKKHELLGFKDKKYNLEEDKNDIGEKIQEDELKIILLKQLKNINEKEQFEQEKLNYNITIIQEKEQEIEELVNEKEAYLKSNNFKSEQDLINLIDNYQRQLATENYNTNKMEIIPRKNKISGSKYLILFLIAIIINVLLFIMLKDSMLKFAGLLAFPTIYLIYKMEKNKIKEEEIISKNKQDINKKVEQNKVLIHLDKIKKIQEQINLKNAQIQIIEKNRNDEIDKLEQIQSKIKTLKEIEKEKMKNTYRNQMDIYEINKLLNVKDVDYELEKIQSRANERKLELHRIDLSKENIMPQLDDLARVEEEITNTQDEYDDLMKKNNAMIVVKQALENAYEKMKSTVTPKFTNNLSENISRISNGKYNKVAINDEKGLMVELNSGDYVSAERLSVGTIDQLYLSLRLSMTNDISTENMPIILDEAFAFYDDDRLENLLKYLIDNFYDKQIIILTCTSREEEILKRLRYEFNKVLL